MKAQLKRCTNCLMPETRPRITFDAQGVCNACQWAEEKKSINWAARMEQLNEICQQFRSKTGNFDCIVPVSGGKDSSYVSYMMKHELKMHPLCVNIVPPLGFETDTVNLRNFNDAGYDLLMIAPNANVSRQIARQTFEEFGRPLWSWMSNVQVAVFKTAIKFGIPLIMFGEEGETEYGGTSKLKDSPVYDVEDSVEIYLSGNDPARYLAQFSAQELYWWLFPSADQFREANLTIAHWSYFENWDPYHHYLVAKEKCGLSHKPAASVGTYNNFCATDTSLFDLHVYLMFLKFGFGRCTSDVGIDIRRGAMTREQAVELVKRLDGTYPEPYIESYCQYLRMTREEFDAVIDHWANKDLFEKKDGLWRPLFEVE